MKARDFKANVRHAARVLNFEEPTKVVQYRQLLQTSSQVRLPPGGGGGCARP